MTSPTSTSPGVMPAMPQTPAMSEKVTKPYGKVDYADPGYRDGQARYPVNTPKHVRSAWAYINMPKNANKYTSEQLKDIKARIKAAAEKHGVEISETESASRPAGMDMENYDGASLIAGAAPLQPPATWFENPGFSAPTKLRVSEDGHVSGHLAQWRVCHVGIGNSCVMAPKSRMDYAMFKVGTVVADDGSEIDVGKLVMGSAHANAQYGVMPARDFYDNSSMTAAVVNIGEDKFGIWVNGALSTNMTPEKVAELRACALSGDWRQINGGLELIAALAVNSPGFPIYRENGGRAFSLMAVGVLDDPEAEATEGEFSTPPTGIQAGAATVADPEQQARQNRLKEIEGDLQKHVQSKRSARLAKIDGQRQESADYRPVANDNPDDVKFTLSQMLDRPVRLMRQPEAGESGLIDFSDDNQQ